MPHSDYSVGNHLATDKVTRTRMSVYFTSITSTAVLLAMLMVAAVVVVAEVNAPQRPHQGPRGRNMTAIPLSSSTSSTKTSAQKSPNSKSSPKSSVAKSSDMASSPQRQYEVYAHPQGRDQVVVRHVHQHHHDHRHQGQVDVQGGPQVERAMGGNGNDFGMMFQWNPDQPGSWAEELFPKLGNDEKDGKRNNEDNEEDVPEDMDINEVVFVDDTDEEDLQLLDVDSRLRSQILSALQSHEKNNIDAWDTNEDSLVYNTDRSFYVENDDETQNFDNIPQYKLGRSRRRPLSVLEDTKNSALKHLSHPRHFFREDKIAEKEDKEDKVYLKKMNNDIDEKEMNKFEENDKKLRRDKTRRRRLQRPRRRCDVARLAHTIFTASKLVPNVVESSPRQLLELRFDAGPTYPGMHVSATFTQSTPRMRWRAEHNELYTVLVANLDFEGTESGQFFHWGLFNIRETRLRSGTTLVRRIAPFVPLGNGKKPVRFGYFVFSQNRRRLELEQNVQPVCSTQATRGRSQRTVQQLMSDEQLELVAATFLLVTPDEVSEQLSCRLHNCLKGETKHDSEEQCRIVIHSNNPQ